MRLYFPHTSCFLPAIYRRGVRYGACSCFYLFVFLGSYPLTMLLPVSVYLILLFDLIWFDYICFDCCPPLPLLFHFYSAVWHILRCPCPCLPTWVVLNCLYMVTLSFFRSLPRRTFFSYPTRIICGCPLFISPLFVFCLLVFAPESLPGDDVLCRLLSRARILLSAFFPVCLFRCFLRSCSFPVCFGVTFSIL